jgi:hypothetical protein
VGSVHERLEFWKVKIGADEYVLNIVKEGYRLPVFPGTERIRYRVRNNKSARDEGAFVLEEVLRLEAAGLVVRCVSQPLCCNPLSVAFKIKPDGSYKKRLVIDLSRHVNRLCTDSKYRMCTLTMKGDFQYVFDLESAYHHLRIHPDSYRFLGFCVTIEGCEVFFVYIVLVFGLKTAGQLLGRVLKPVLIFLAEGVVRLLVYIDDGRGSAASKDLADEHYALVLCILASAGFTVSFERSEGPGESARVKEYLGFILDTEHMCVTVPEHKLIQIKRDLGIFLEKSRHSCRVVASIVGRINSLEAALGTEVYVSTRMSTNELVTALDQWGLDSDLFLSDDAVLGLVWLLGALDELNGHPICAPHTCISLASVLPRDSEISLDRKIPAGRYQSLMASLASDVWDTAVAAFCIDGLPQFEMVYELSAEERTYSSSRRELIAFL